MPGPVGVWEKLKINWAASWTRFHPSFHVSSHYSYNHSPHLFFIFIVLSSSFCSLWTANRQAFFGSICTSTYYGRWYKKTESGLPAKWAFVMSGLSRRSSPVMINDQWSTSLVCTCLARCTCVMSGYGSGNLEIFSVLTLLQSTLPEYILYIYTT